MSKKIILTLLAIVVIAIAGIGVLLYLDKEPKKVITIDASSNSSTIKARPSQQIVINLESNPSTGFSWQLADSYDQAVVTKESNTFTKNSSGAIGAPGTEVWTFKAVGKGATTLKFSYLRSWETNTAPVQIKQFNITVD